ncbi:disks large-associated protein 5 [Elysia marginata]|uniref:Disks large-associated protein 5 n=1 Tax=Elysia marginata TaxID=1093978 RepID=A0AAV4JVM8_9GAST|nr:disks large-associated protein 5 [Elysia marginata]
MPSKSIENSFRTIYKSRSDSEASASIASRRRSVRNDRKQRRDERLDKRRGLLDMSDLSETDNTLDIDQDPGLDVQGEEFQTRRPTKPSSKDTRAVSLKERLKKWREEKQKLTEQKKKQPPAFVVKSLEYKSDSGLYSKAPKNAKKLPKPESSYNFAENLKGKPVLHGQKNVKPLMKHNNDPAAKSNQSLKKPTDAQTKQAIPTRTMATRNTRQADKTEEQVLKANPKKTLTREVKSFKDLHSAVQESKPKSRPVRGDLHLRLTAAAAAKKENTDKPKEFLRAKPHFAPGRTTRSQAKQNKSEDVQVSGHTLATGKQPSSVNIASAQSKKLSAQRQVLTLVSDSDGGVSAELRESPRKNLRRANTNGTLEVVESDESSIAKNTSESDDQSGMDQPVRKRELRRSVVAAKKEQAVSEKNMENVPSSSKRGKKLSDWALKNVESEASTVSGNTTESNDRSGEDEPTWESPVLTKTSSCRKGEISLIGMEPSKSKAKDRFASLSEVIKNEDTVSPVRKPRLSKINSASAVRTSRRSVAKSVFESTEDQQNFTHETEKCTSVDEQVINEVKVQATPSKRNRQSVKEATMVQEDQIQENETYFSPKQAKLSVPSADEGEITNLAVIFTPGKKTRRSVFKVLSREETTESDATSSSVEVTLTATPDKKLKLASSKHQLESSMCRRKSRRCTAASICSEKRNSQIEATPRRKSQHLASESTVSNESSTNSESDSRSTERQTTATPVRKSRRSVAPIAYSEKRNNQAKATPRRKSQHLASESTISNESSTNSESDSRSTEKQTTATPVRKSRRSVAPTAYSEKRNSPAKATPRRGSQHLASESTISNESCTNSESDSRRVAVVDQAVTPNSSFSENKFPGNEQRRRKSVRRSAANFPREEDMTDSTAYRLAKPDSAVAETGPLQELQVEKIDGEASYIEVPMDESETSLKDLSPLAEETTNNVTPIEEPDTSSNSSVGTEPFTPRKSCNVTKASQESLPLVEATPDLPPRLPVRQFKTPFQAPRSAVRAKTSSTRLRRKTEHSTPRSPEEVIRMLEKSPMIEMTRRRSRHVSSPASILPLDFDTETSFPASTSSPKTSGLDKYPETIPLLTSGEQLGTENATVDTLVQEECSDGKQVSDTDAPSVDLYVMERVNHFRNILTTETNRLNQLCKTWDEIGAYTFGISEDIQGQIRTTVGKAQLLIDQRFKQFSGLVDNCEFNLGEQKTRPEDLQGFWEMIYFQVGKRSTLGSQTNSPKAASPGLDVKPTEVSSETDCQSPKPDSSAIPVVANKENEDSHRGPSTPVCRGAQGNPLSQVKLPVKRLSYVPVIPSPLLKDTTGITTPKKI